MVQVLHSVCNLLKAADILVIVQNRAIFNKNIKCRFSYAARRGLLSSHWMQLE